MSSRPFKANSWLKIETPMSEGLPELPDAENRNSYGHCNAKFSENFFSKVPPIPSIAQGSTPNLTDFFIPGWAGNSLFSKSANSIKKIQEQFWKDALNQFKSLKGLNKSLKVSVFNEFHSFCEHIDFKEPELEIQQNFWSHLHHPSSPHRKTLDQFLEVYCFRVGTVYLYKLLFIYVLAKEIKIDICSNQLLNPTNFLSKCFPSGSHFELNCDALKTNQYSWYRASSCYADQINDLIANFEYLSIGQLMKLTSYRDLKGTPTNCIFDDNDYSHALSHESFGQFINGLIVFLPLWLKNDKLTYPQSIPGGIPKCLKTKFAGDMLTSLCHSHWLAQESYLDRPWSEIISPSFSKSGFNHGHFIKVCHEFQFLTFLVSFCKNQNYPVIETLTKTIKDKYKTNQTEDFGQTNLFSRYDQKSELSYQRIILMISELPKKNPHHYIIQQINEQKSDLEAEGLLFLFSNQNLFVPSQVQRVSQMLQDFQLVAHFNFEDTQGRGEVPSFLYVLKKRKVNTKDNNKIFSPFSTEEKSSQEACLNFRISGELRQFQQFESIVEALYDFYQSKSATCTPLFTRSISEGLHFEFHQDAIIEGRLLSSISEDNQRITHPSFFKTLTKKSLPFANFFNVEPASQQEKKDFKTDLLGIKKREIYPYLLIVDYRDSADVGLEIYPGSSYHAKKEELGVAYFQYFALNPKINNININLFREYFKTQIGKQLIQLSLSGSTTKTKSKINALLVPQFFSDHRPLSSSILEELSLLGKSEDEIKDIHPDQLMGNFSSTLEIVNELEVESPWMILSLLTHFKLNIVKVLNQFHEAQTNNYNNPLVLKPLLELKSSPVYQSDEVFIDYKISDIKSLHRSVDKMIIVNTSESDSHLEIYSNNEILAELHSDHDLLNFVKFIIENSGNTLLSEILKNLHLPKIEEFKIVISNFNQMKTCFNTISTTLHNKIDQVFIRQIGS